MQLDGQLLLALVRGLEHTPPGGAFPRSALPGYPDETVAVHMHWLRNAGLATAAEGVGRPTALTGFTQTARGLRHAAADEARWLALIERLRRYPAHQMATALYAHTRE